MNTGRNNSKLPAVDMSVKLSSLADFSDRISSMAEELREQILAPKPRKEAPTFTSTQVMEMCSLDRARFNYLLSKDGYPQGVLAPSGRIRTFTLAQTRQWIALAAKLPKSPLSFGEPANGKVIVVNQLKGGSTKTTTAMCLAQGLNLRGRKVLIVDLDPQASITELCGIYAEQDVTANDTILNYIFEPATSQLRDVVRDTYWDDISIIPAHPSLFGAEFHLPAMTMQDKRYQFWSVLREGLEPLRQDFDYIILDTAPSLSYLTINALFAGDAMVMPLVPESLDFISSVSFWKLFSDITQNILPRDVNPDRSYDFVSVLLSKVDNSPSSSASVVRSWAQRAYGEWLNKLEVPASSAMSQGALGLATAFDFSTTDARKSSTTRVRDPLQEYCGWIDSQYSANWRDK